MARLSTLEMDVVDAHTRELYAHYLRERGRVPNMMKTMAHRPEILRTGVAHLRAILESGTVPLKLKELLIVRTSQINGCHY